MTRQVSVSVQNRIDDTITRPGYLIEIAGVSYTANSTAYSSFYITSRDTDITYNSKLFQKTFDFNISGFSWDGSGNQKGRIEFNDSARFDASNTSTVSNIILYNKMAGAPVKIYLFYYFDSSTFTSNDVVEIFTGLVDETEIMSNGRVGIGISTDLVSSLFSPRRYIRPSDPITDSAHNIGFNSVPPAGTIITWNDGIYTLERANN